MSASRSGKPSPEVIAALVGVLVAEALRRGRTGDGIEVRPTRQILFASSLLGLFCALSLRHQPPIYWVHVLFLYTAIYTGLAVLPDQADSFERRRDIVGALPIRAVDAAVARIIFLGLLIGFLIFPLATPSLVWLGARGAYGPLCLAALAGSQLALGLTVSASWLYLAYSLGVRIGVDRVRRVASVLLSLLVAGSSIMGTSSLWARSFWPRELGEDLLAALPTSWFAAPLLGGPAGQRWAEGGAALALLALSLLLAARTDPTAAYATARSGSRQQKDTWTCRLLAALDRSAAGSGSRLLPLVLFLSRIWGRDALARMRLRAFATSTLVVVALGWLWSGAPLAIRISVALVGFMALIDGTFGIAMSGDSGAAWLLGTTPVPAERMIAAVRATALAGRGLLPALLLGGLVAHGDGLLAGFAMTIAFLGVGYLLVSALQAIRPRAPFAQQSSAARGSTEMWLATPLSFLGIVLLAPAFFLATLPGPFGVASCAVFASTAYAFGRAFGIGAARRFARTAMAG